MSTKAIGWWSSLFLVMPILGLFIGSRHAVEVPACAACRGRMRRQKIVRTAVTAAFIVAGVMLADRVLGNLRGLNRLLAAGIVLGACLPWFLWQALFPPPFDVTAYSEHVEYEFASAEYAHEFAELNGGSVED